MLLLAGQRFLKQVVGFKVGMLFGGGLLLWLSAAVDWSGLFLIIAALVLAVLLGVLALHRSMMSAQTANATNSANAANSKTASAATTDTANKLAAEKKAQPMPVAAVIKALWSAMRATGAFSPIQLS